jgi:hypothetical protein
MAGANGRFAKGGNSKSAGIGAARAAVYRNQERAAFALRVRSVSRDIIQGIYNSGDNGPLDRLKAAGSALSRARASLAGTVSAMAGLPKHGASYVRPKGLTKKQANAAANDFARQRQRRVSLTQEARRQNANIREARGRQRAAMNELRSIRNARSREQNRAGLQLGLFG